jgi:two-component system, NtrC family, response regulator HydG
MISLIRSIEDQSDHRSGGKTSVMSASDEVATAVAARHAPPPRPVFRLEVTRGPEAGQSYLIDGSLPGSLLVGQSPVCDFRLSDPHVSRRHATFDLSGSELSLTDLGSTNGTRVNGVAIGTARLEGGEQILIGQSLISVVRVTGSRQEPASTHERFGKLQGKSPEMRRLYPLLERLAQTNVPVVIEGETGTGKEVVAEALHAASPRARGPFIVFDCTTVAPTLVEAELFGHERGAFTGAVSARRGVFEQAHGGTLLIDEIGDLELTLQPKLLRALERSEVKRIGSDRPSRVDVRVIAATRRDLDQAVEDGRFRDDLYHRLAVARVELPPLRRRHGDVRVLAEHFARELGGGALSEKLLARFEAHDWSGNVRELRNAVARQIALGDLLDAPPPVSQPAASGASDAFLDRVIASGDPLPVARLKVVREFERRYIQHVLDEHGGNVAEAAAASGLALRYFQLLRSGKRR